MSPSPQQDGDADRDLNLPTDVPSPSPPQLTVDTNPSLLSGGALSAIPTLASGDLSPISSSPSGPSPVPPTARPNLIPANAPAGGVSLTIPSNIPGVTSLFKIYLTPTTRADGLFNTSQNAILFGWNVTSVLLEPTSLSVRAKCDNGYTYPIGKPIVAPTGTGDSGTSSSDDSPSENDDSGLIPYNQTLVTWDPVAQQARHPATPLPLGMCTLQIFDPDRAGGITAAPRPGYFSPNQAVISFALYTGEAYTPLESGKFDAWIKKLGSK